MLVGASFGFPTCKNSCKSLKKSYISKVHCHLMSWFFQFTNILGNPPLRYQKSCFAWVRYIILLGGSQTAGSNRRKITWGFPPNIPWRFGVRSKLRLAIHKLYILHVKILVRKNQHDWLVYSWVWLLSCLKGAWCSMYLVTEGR